MERLWSPAGATGGNRSQMGEPQKRLKQADRQLLATHGNGSAAHGKEHVYHRLPSFADDPFLVREEVDSGGSEGEEPCRTRRSAGLEYLTEAVPVGRARSSTRRPCACVLDELYWSKSVAAPVSSSRCAS